MGQPQKVLAADWADSQTLHFVLRKDHKREEGTHWAY